MYWYHANDVKNGREWKIRASEFGDDYQAIPAYEQIMRSPDPCRRTG